jgi:hypothetical protein
MHLSRLCLVQISQLGDGKQRAESVSVFVEMIGLQARPQQLLDFVWEPSVAG